MAALEAELDRRRGIGEGRLWPTLNKAKDLEMTKYFRHSQVFGLAPVQQVGYNRRSYPPMYLAYTLRATVASLVPRTMARPSENTVSS